VPDGTEDNKKEVSEMDKNFHSKLRHNVSDFIGRCGREYDRPEARVLDIAPQDHEGANPYFKLATVETLDIDASSGATYIADICVNNETMIASEHFDYIVCTEVLEHTLQPFDAVREIKRMLKPGGLVLVSVPFNFRIHGPLPDCWRFTEHGLRALFKDFKIKELTPLETEDRFLMPIHYTLVAQKPLTGESNE
jgi:SAM-dependent methyltransferase